MSNLPMTAIRLPRSFRTRSASSHDVVNYVFLVRAVAWGVRA